ncbi:17270_t:CDS:2 [Entrophospora sp. SA101]|nr:17270_t:CDS:2 [Entrophospora sp. SA101]
MALKYELEQWGSAVKYYDEQNFEKSLETFETIADSAKFHFNIGLIFATLGEHEEACTSYKKSVKLDEYFAVAYFQKGVSHFLLSEFQKALNTFNDALMYLRGNMLIDYEQLGLKFRLYSCEVLFNRGLCYLYLGETDKGLDDFRAASKEKQTEEHDVIDEAIDVQGQDFTVFSIPVGVIYRPPEGKLKNVKTKDYLGKAKLVAAIDPEDAFTGFTGAQQQKVSQLNTTSPISKSKTGGKVDEMNGSSLRPDSVSEKFNRPRSLSSNPRAPPFPITRNQSFSKRLPTTPGSPDLTYSNEENFSLNGQQLSSSYSDSIPRSKSPSPYQNDTGKNDNNNDSQPPPRTISVRRPPQLRLQPQPPQRSNTIDNGRPSPKFAPPSRLNSVRDPNRHPPSIREGPTRSNSYRGDPPPQSRSNSIRGVPRMNSTRGRGTGRPGPQRQNTQVRAEFLRQQMSKMNVSDDSSGSYPDYYQDSDQYNSDQKYDYDQYYNDGDGFNSPKINSNNGSRSPVTSPARSPSLRGRGNNSISMPGFKPSPLSAPTGMLSPPSDNIVMVAADISYSELLKRIQEKFASDSSFNLHYKDEDGEKVRMTDQEDLDMAVSLIPKSTSEIGRMEVWLD